MPVSWEGFVSKSWNPRQLRIEREEWQKVYGPRLRERDRQQAEARDRARAAWMTLSDEQAEALLPYAPVFIKVLPTAAGGAA